MEKFNGNKITMDKACQVYSRRCYLPMDVMEFIHTNLNCVRQTRQSIESLETYLMSETGLASGLFTNMIIYGELMCQHVKVYDEFTYTQCGVLHKQIPYGCLIQVNENQSVKDVVKVLNKAGFAARLREQTTDTHQIFMNSKLLDTLKNFEFDIEK